MTVKKGDQVTVSSAYVSTYGALLDTHAWLLSVGTVEVVPGAGDDYEGFPTVRYADGRTRREVPDSALMVQGEPSPLERAVAAERESIAAKQALLDVPAWSAGNSGPGWSPR